MILVEAGVPAGTGRSAPAGRQQPRGTDSEACVAVADVTPLRHGAARPVRRRQAGHRDAAPPGPAGTARATTGGAGMRPLIETVAARPRRAAGRGRGRAAVLQRGRRALPAGRPAGGGGRDGRRDRRGAARHLPAVRREPGLGSGREPRGGAGDRRQLRPRGLHRRLRERPRRHAARPRLDRRVPVRHRRGVGGGASPTSRPSSPARRAAVASPSGRAAPPTSASTRC